MSKAIWWSIVIFGAALIGAIFYYAMPRMQREPAVDSLPAPVAPSAPATAEPQTHFPVPDDAQGRALPALNESDPAMKEALASLWSGTTVESVLQLKDFIRRMVVTIDNLPRRKLALRLSPLKPAAGRFVIAGGEENPVIAPDNAARYAPYMRLAGAVDTGKVVALYVRFYPLFQQAYQDLGYPNAYFNDRLIEVIDHLLAAPEVKPPVRLVRPKVFYELADPELEARSAGEKILVRIGTENAARIKAKLRDIRSELVRQPPRP